MAVKQSMYKGSSNVSGIVNGNVTDDSPLQTNGLTNTELRATPVPVSGPLTNTALRAAPVDVSGPLTDTQLRATAIPVTASAGTNLNTSALALEAGGNLAGIKAVTDQLDFDPVTTHPLVINHDHGEIHDGNNYFYTDPVTLNAAAVQDYLITTPNTAVRAHFLFDIVYLFVTEIQLYEGADRTGTTLQTTHNSYRPSSNVAATTVHKGTSGGTTDGTLIFNYQGGLPTGAGATLVTQGGTLNGRNEIVLKANTKYILRITSSTAANLINTLLSWYEI